MKNTGLKSNLPAKHKKRPITKKTTKATHLLDYTQAQKALIDVVEHPT
jgi:hypothetical protein